VQCGTGKEFARATCLSAYNNRSLNRILFESLCAFAQTAGGPPERFFFLRNRSILHGETAWHCTEQ